MAGAIILVVAIVVVVVVEVVVGAAAVVAGFLVALPDIGEVYTAMIKTTARRIKDDECMFVLNAYRNDCVDLI